MHNHSTYTNKTPSAGLGIYLLAEGLLKESVLQTAIAEADKQACCLTQYLVQEHILSSEQILSCCAKYFAIPIFDKMQFDATIFADTALKPELMIRLIRYHVIPLYRDNSTLYLGITDPTNQLALNSISFLTNLSIIPRLISEADYQKFLTAYKKQKGTDYQLENTLLQMSSSQENTNEDLDATEEESPISEFLSHLFNDAIQQHISDIHIESFSESCRIRFRRDGLLYEATTVPIHLAARIITRLKILSSLNIAEKRLPQDGRLQLTAFPGLDVRINTCPTLYGEKIVLRLLNTNHIKLNINDLGMHQSQEALFISYLTQAQGLILVTGPTGSGKTISLYSALNYLNQIERNISTVEDPIEIELPGINQININLRIGFDFAIALKALLRQDPDVIMLGEIRDLQTAIMAFQAAQTGHLVLSTLHTNSAIESLNRLYAMGVPSFYFKDSLSLIIAQRLIRKLCVQCREPIIAMHSNMSANAKGCEYCHHGYAGRTGIFELLAITPEVSDLFNSHFQTKHINKMLKRTNFLALHQHGMEKVSAGITTLTELKRVIGYSLVE